MDDKRQKKAIVLVRVSTAGKRHRDFGNTYKGKTWNWVTYSFQTFSPLSWCDTVARRQTQLEK